MQYVGEVARHGELEEYLLQQQRSAAASFDLELVRKDQQFTRFWRYTGLPVKQSHLALDPEKVASVGLIDSKSLMDVLHRARTKEVLNPPEIFEFNNAAAALHHLNQTAATLNRRAQCTGQIEQARSRSLQASGAFTWQKLPPQQLKELIKVSHERHKQTFQSMTGVLLVDFCFRLAFFAFSWLCLLEVSRQ
jgi:hypothetical protein